MERAVSSIGERVRRRRTIAGLSQAELARRADVSRALVGSVERARHVPAADAAIRLARALGTSVEDLFGPERDERSPTPVAPVVGPALPDGAVVRAAWVQDRLVGAALDVDGLLGAAAAGADGTVERGCLRPFAGAAPGGAVVAGCDPALAVAEAMLGDGGSRRLVGAPATSGTALRALGAGRCHAAIVHGPGGTLAAPAGLRRWHVARWRSGLGSHPSLRRPSLESVLAGGPELVRRDGSAASQQALDRAARRLGVRARAGRGPVAHGHLQAARMALDRAAVAVTIEPVAAAAGLDFRALEVHDVELWVPEAWVALPGIAALVELLGGARLRQRLGALRGYDVAAMGAAR